MPNNKPPDSRMIKAAGAVAWRPRPDGGEPEVLLVHRKKYDDWSLPKGKAEPGEPLPVTAVREVLDEGGARLALGAVSNTWAPFSTATSYWSPRRITPADASRLRGRHPRPLHARPGWLAPALLHSPPPVRRRHQGARDRPLCSGLAHPRHHAPGARRLVRRLGLLTCPSSGPRTCSAGGRSPVGTGGSSTRRT